MADNRIVVRIEGVEEIEDLMRKAARVIEALASRLLAAGVTQKTIDKIVADV